MRNDTFGAHGTAYTDNRRPKKAHLPRAATAKGHEPYTLGAGKRACLLVHGIAGSPAQMRTLADELAKLPLTVRGTLLPGHGTCPEDLEGIVWQDWFEHLHDEYRALRSQYDEVYLVGFSIGAALSAYYAAHNPVDRLVLLNVPLCPLNDRFPTDLMLRIYGAFFKEVKGNAEVLTDEDGEPFCFVYERVPTATLHTMSEFIGIVRENLYRIRSPLLIIQSRNDNVSGGRSGLLVHDKAASRHKRLVMLEKSRHSVMMDIERDVVFREINSFLNGELLKK
jgi:carboxylesterase